MWLLVSFIIVIVRFTFQFMSSYFGAAAVVIFQSEVSLNLLSGGPGGGGQHVKSRGCSSKNVRRPKENLMRLKETKLSMPRALGYQFII